MNGHIHIIAGPCSAESASQVYDTANALKALGVNDFRAGLWKPRTRPDSYEGPGEEGLPWLAEVQRKLGMRVWTEVAGAQHVRMCLDAGLKSFWIGARTTANPFLVQEIADALQDSGASVMVKNPVSKDVALWAGAVERLLGAGVNIEALVLRGYTSFEPVRYRNDPQWQTVAQMRSRFPQIPVLCDPSHIAGKREYVAEIASRALELGLDGLMVECHMRPLEARSDAQQQLTPSELGTLLQTLELRPCGAADSRIAALRAEIDDIDSRLVALLASRMEVSAEIGELKREGGVAILQPGRWQAVLDQAVADGESRGLSPDFVRDLFTLIHEQSLKKQ